MPAVLASSHIGTGLVALFLSQLPANEPENALKDEPSIQHPSTHVEDMDEAPNSGLAQCSC